MTLRLPARTIRMRLTLAYGGLFLTSGTVMLAVTYFLVRHKYTGGFFLSSGRVAVAQTLLAKGSVGAVPTPEVGQVSGNVFRLPPGAQAIKVAAHAQSTAALHQLLINSGIALAIMGLLSLWLGWVIAGRALRPLRTITNTAREITASNLHKRLSLEGPNDELTQLGSTFDDLLERLEMSFAAQRQFVANASHELRTPLTLERALIEVALSDPHADTDSLRETCERVLAVGEQQERLIEALLTLSRSQRGLDVREPVDLRLVTEAAVAAVEPDGLSITTTLQHAATNGDPRLVERLAANLVDNAVRHNVPGGRIDIETATRDGASVLTVANSGPAIQPAELARLFRPFQRLNGGRGNHPDGLGLGLSIVDAVARAHDATLTAEANASGGLRVTVAFPTA
ncbi:MAG TPA: ATP-binding protein [Gaiellaceae bacterium]